MKHGKKLAGLAIGVAGLLAIGLMTGAASQKEEPIEVEADSRLVVETASPHIDDIIVTGEYVGTVEPSRQVVVYPKVSGEVLDVHFNIGDTVQQGDVLLQLDSTSLRYDISLAQANLSKAQSQAQLSLEQAKQNQELYDHGVQEGYNATLLSAESAVAKAETALQEANAGLVSARRALRDARDENDDNDEYYTDSQMHQFRDAVVLAETKVESAQVGLEQAQINLDAVKLQLADQRENTETAIRSAELSSNFNSESISIQKMQNTLGDYTIVSPINGVIEQRNVDPYDMASSQTPLFVISNKEAMTVSFQVSETTWANMRAGDSVTIEKQGRSWPGTIVEISTMANTNGGLYTIKANVENAPFDLNTGSTVKIFAEMQSSRDTLLIPIDSLYYEGSATYVFVYRSGLVKKAVLETGISDAVYTEVLSGLSASDLVITTWNSAIMDGVEVLLLEDYLLEMENDLFETSGEESATLDGALEVAISDSVSAEDNSPSDTEESEAGSDVKDSTSVAAEEEQ